MPIPSFAAGYGNSGRAVAALQLSPRSVEWPDAAERPDGIQPASVPNCSGRPLKDGSLLDVSGGGFLLVLAIPTQKAPPAADV